jgi:hypothetical protein
MAAPEDGRAGGAARDEVVDHARNPLAGDPKAHHVDAGVHPRELEVALEQPGLARDDGQRAQEPAVLQATLDDVGWGHGVLEEQRLQTVKEFPWTLPWKDFVRSVTCAQRAAIGWEKTVGKKGSLCLKMQQWFSDFSRLFFQGINPT